MHIRLNGELVADKLEWKEEIIFDSTKGVSCDGKLMIPYKDGDVLTIGVMNNCIGTASNIRYPMKAKQ